MSRTLRSLAAAASAVVIVFLWTGCDSAPVEDDPPVAEDFSMLQTDGHRIVNEEGEEVTLRGVNLGNWLMLEMWMLRVSGEIHDQYTFENVLAERFGEEEKDRLMELYRESWITERDFEIIRSFGMNTVRLPFYYTLLEDDDRPFEIRTDGWKWLDRAIEMAEDHGLYVILDMHGAPGAQWTEHHAGRANYNRLWYEEEYRDRTVWLWEQIAARYRDRESVAAYDLLNEAWGSERAPLKALMSRCYDAIRSVDPNHIIIFSSYFNDVSFYGPPEASGWENVAYTVHYYPGLFGNGSPTIETHKRFIQNELPGHHRQFREMNVPILVGEFNVAFEEAGGAEMMRRYFDKYADYGWAATMWSYKVLTNEGGIDNAGWGMVTNADGRPSFDLREWPLQAIEHRFRSLADMPYDVDEELRYWLTTDEEPPAL